jgi:excisionase family DNA binding protein
MPEQELYTIPQAAQILGRTEGAIRTMIHRRQIPVTRIGQKRIFISREVLNDLLRGQLVVDAPRITRR